LVRPEEQPVGLGYDIFRKLEDGTAVWVGTAPTLIEAQDQLRTLAAANPSSYFVRDATTGRIITDGGTTNFDRASA
jgi:hypothetical protein